jgi:hypothetical protein
MEILNQDRRTMERRKHHRIKTHDLSIVVSDGLGLSDGVVSDISLSGIQVIDLPERINLTTWQLSVILTENRKLFRMNVSPIWFYTIDGKISLGVRIRNTPLGWADFILKHKT